VVQYNTLGTTAAAGDFNSGKYTPFPTTLSRARVSVEEAPVRILDPANPVFHSPNEITQKDFEAGAGARAVLHVAVDSNFTPLLESHDPGEASRRRAAPGALRQGDLYLHGICVLRHCRQACRERAVVCDLVSGH